MIDLDDYDRAFLESLQGNSENPEREETLICEMLEVFDDLNEEGVNKFDQLFAKDWELLTQLEAFTRRSIFYEKRTEEYLSKVDGANRVSKHCAAYAVVPWALQEWEGTVKKGLQVLGYLLARQHGEDVDWDEYRSRYSPLSHVLDGVASRLEEGSELRLFIGELDPSRQLETRTDGIDIILNRVRRSIAHSDYTLRRGWITFRDEDGFTEASDPEDGGMLRISVEGFLEMFLSYEHDVKRLNVGLHLGFRRFTGQPGPNVDPGGVYGSESTHNWFG